MNYIIVNSSVSCIISYDKKNGEIFMKDNFALVAGSAVLNECISYTTGLDAHICDHELRNIINGSVLFRRKVITRANAHLISHGHVETKIQWKLKYYSEENAFDNAPCIFFRLFRHQNVDILTVLTTIPMMHCVYKQLFLTSPPPPPPPHTHNTPLNFNQLFCNFMVSLC